MKHTFDAIILGAGAAGLMAPSRPASAAVASWCWNRRTRIGKKILISGGGRCNFTNLHCRPDTFYRRIRISRNRHSRVTHPRDFIAMVERHRIAYHEKTLGQLFCDRSAHEISPCSKRNVARQTSQIRTET